MVTFSRRFPSRQASLQVLAAFALPIFVWSVVNVLESFPAWILRYNIWDLLGIFAYTQVYALIEAIIACALLVILAAILPARIFRERFVAVGSMVAILVSLWFIFLHLNDNRIRALTAKQFLSLSVLVFGLAFIVAIVATDRFTKLNNVLDSAVQRISVLSYLFLSFGVISLAIIIARNI